MRTVIRQSTDQPLQLTSQLGAGGEAVIYALGDDLVAKIYHQWRAESQDKLPAMLAHPPSDLLQGQHVAIAWPYELLYDKQVRDRIVGFLSAARRAGCSRSSNFTIPNPAEASAHYSPTAICSPARGISPGRCTPCTSTGMSSGMSTSRISW